MAVIDVFRKACNKYDVLAKVFPKNGLISFSYNIASLLTAATSARNATQASVYYYATHISEIETCHRSCWYWYGLQGFSVCEDALIGDLDPSSDHFLMGGLQLASCSS